MATVLASGFAPDLNGETLAGFTQLDFHVDERGFLVCSPDPGKDFVVGIYYGETEQKIALPAIVVSCPSATEDMDARGNYSCEVDVAVQFPADSTDQNPWTVPALQYVGDGVRNILGHYTLPDLLTAAVDDFGVMGVEDRQTVREVEGRTRTQRHSMRLYCCGRTI